MKAFVVKQSRISRSACNNEPRSEQPSSLRQFVIVYVASCWLQEKLGLLANHYMMESAKSQ